MSIKLKLVEDWQPISIIPVEETYNQGIYVDNEFVDLDMFMRYGTHWLGEAPECYDEDNNKIEVVGVSNTIWAPYFIEVDDNTQEVRIWMEVDK